MIYSATRFLWALGFLMLMAVVTLPSIDRWIFSDAPDPAAAQQQTAQSATDDGTSRTPATTADARRQLDEADQNLAEAIRLSEVWKRESAPLESGPAGQTIAQNEELSALMAHVFAAERPTADELSTLRQQGDELRQQLADHADGPGSATLLAELRQAIGAWHADVSEAHESWNRVVHEAQAIVRESQRSAPDEQNPDGETLAKSMQASRDGQTLEQMRKDIQREQERVETEQAEKERQAKLELEAQSPEVLGALAPFVTPRTAHPQMSGASVVMRKTFEEQPVSLAWLKQIGALDPSVDGLKMLARVGAARKLPEPRWTIPTQPNGWTPETEAFLKDAQQKLRDYGPTLVGLGKLSP
ncbi:MAG: hypothetical protein DWQ34_24490 [Planctomycetota bacterium]|nr:MAG: hypothetical protein DWQ34_24490 [Planctomycetota bacterium]